MSSFLLLHRIFSPWQKLTAEKISVHADLKCKEYLYSQHSKVLKHAYHSLHLSDLLPAGSPLPLLHLLNNFTFHLHQQCAAYASHGLIVLLALLEIPLLLLLLHSLMCGPQLSQTSGPVRRRPTSGAFLSGQPDQASRTHSADAARTEQLREASRVRTPAGTWQLVPPAEGALSPEGSE